MFTKKTLILLAVLLTLVSCSKNNRNGNYNDNYSEPVTSVQAAQPQSAEQDITVVPERKFIRQGEIRFETGNLSETKEKLLRNVEEVKGYVSNENSLKSDDRITQTLVVRVPADKFDIFLKKIDQLTEKFDMKRIQALDVTEEFIDVEARMNTRKELEKRYLDLLKSAKNVEEILSIEREIGKLREEIESVEGRLKYLKDNISFSTLNIEFYQNTHTSFGFFSKVKDGFYNGWELLLLMLVGLSHLWAVALAIVLLILILRWKRRKRKPKKS